MWAFLVSNQDWAFDNKNSQQFHKLYTSILLRASEHNSKMWKGATAIYIFSQMSY